MLVHSWLEFIQDCINDIRPIADGEFLVSIIIRKYAAIHPVYYEAYAGAYGRAGAVVGLVFCLEMVRRLCDKSRTVSHECFSFSP